MPEKLWVVAVVDSLHLRDDDGKAGYYVDPKYNQEIFRVTLNEGQALQIAEQMAMRNPGREVQIMAPDRGMHCGMPPKPIMKKWVNGEYLPT